MPVFIEKLLYFVMDAFRVKFNSSHLFCLPFMHFQVGCPRPSVYTYPHHIFIRSHGIQPVPSLPKL